MRHWHVEVSHGPLGLTCIFSQSKVLLSGISQHPDIKGPSVDSPYELSSMSGNCLVGMIKGSCVDFFGKICLVT